MRRHFATGLPYAFIAQIDLAEAAILSPATGVLPTEGRLLFFCDIIVGCYDTGTRSCHVIWDRTPAEEISSCPVPEDLAAAEHKYREEMRGISVTYAMDVAVVEREGTNYGTRSRALKLAAEFTFPHEMTDEGQSFWAMSGTVPYPDQDEVWHRSKLLGCSDPEQGDPRWDAVVALEYGVQHLSGERWRECRTDIALKARDWRLLLQLDLADWMQAELVEGTVYFLIQHEDLALRRFERVVTVHQQT